MGKGSRLRQQRKQQVITEENTTRLLNSYWKNFAIQHLTEEDMHVVFKAVEDQLREDTADKIVMAINGGIKIALIAAMESHIVGWHRIERDILPLVQKVYAEWNDDYCEMGHDVDLSMDRLEQRLNLDIQRTTANRKKVDVDEIN